METNSARVRAKFFDNEQLVEMIEQLKLSTTIAKTETFSANASDLPLAFLERCLRYGFQRHFNDSVAGIESKETKYKTVSMDLGEILAGKYEPNKRKEAVPTETNVRRKVVLAALSKDDRKILAKMSDEERAKKLDETFAKNESVLKPAFEEMIREKAKVSVSL